MMAAAVAAACSGGGGEATSTGTEPPRATATSDPASDPAPTTSDAVTATTTPVPSTSAATTTTTTLPPQEILPAGTVWTSTLLEAGTSTNIAEMEVVGEALWAVGSRWNGPVAWRTADGINWNEVAIQGPPDSGAVGLAGIVGRPAGGYLAWGHAGSSCWADIQREGGYRETGLCRRLRPVVFLSDDGEAWRRIDPPVMQPGDGATVLVDDLTAVDDGFVAVGTHRSPDWYGMVWFSPDGENWELVRDLRGVDGPMSGHQVLWDGSTLVLLAHEHPCSQDEINDNSPGWILGSQWADHLRMLAGPDVRELAPVDPDDHPILEPPMTIDCSADGAFFLAMEPYADTFGAVIGGRITLVDDSVLPEPDDTETGGEDGEDEEPLDPRRLVALVDGEWTETIVAGFDRGLDMLVEVDGGPALLRSGPDGAGLSSMELVVADPDGGGWVARTADPPIIGGLVRIAAGFGDSVIAVSRSYADPFTSVRTGEDPGDVLVWSTRDIPEDEVTRCSPAAGGVCQLADFSTLERYPDLSGADLSGADLMFARFGAGDFSDATFAGSNLSGATVDTSDGAPVFTGADFTGANLRGADLEDVAGANLSGADLSAASIGFSAPPASLDGATLTDARLDVVRGADGEYASLEISLAGYDLTGARVRGPLGGEVRLRVTDLRGAVLAGVSFYAVDLTGVQLDAGVDLTDVDVWDNSLCPDGQPPSDGPIGTCVRP